MKNQILLVISILTAGAIVTAAACSDTPMDMPKNDSGTGGQDTGMNPTDSGYNPDVFMPDAGNACDKGIMFDNKGRVPGWPNVPQP